MGFFVFIFLFSQVEILFTNESHISKPVLEEEKNKKLQIIFGTISGSGVVGMPKSKVLFQMY